MGTFPFDLELEDISALADIVNKKKLGEIRLEDDDIGAKIVIKAKLNPPAPPVPPPPAPAQQQPPINVLPLSFAPAAAGAVQTVQENPVQQSPAQTTQKASEKGSVVKAPLVGTFYSSPSPEKPPFAVVGQHIKKGDTIMIIESMKLMNEVQSDFEGEVLEILVENGQSVEYDQPIMIIG